jgi:hypothetical protein
MTGKKKQTEKYTIKVRKSLKKSHRRCDGRGGEQARGWDGKRGT